MYSIIINKIILPSIYFFCKNKFNVDYNKIKHNRNYGISCRFSKTKQKYTHLKKPEPNF